MAEYAWVMKQWQRMFGSMQGGIAKCDNCPLLKVICQYKPDEKADFDEAEKIITDWAAENPEPIYPSWYGWLSSMGIVPIILPLEQAALVTDIGLLKEIPAVTAQKLGIEPKEVG